MGIEVSGPNGLMKACICKYPKLKNSMENMSLVYVGVLKKGESIKHQRVM